jgi:hypothetical protein
MQGGAVHDLTHRILRFAAVVSIVLWLALDASAYRVEFIAIAKGERLVGSEICFHRGLNLHEPASLYFSSDDVRCLPADQIIDLPSGVWAFYGRHRDGWITAHGAAIARRGPALPDRGYQAVRMGLEPSGFVSFEQVSRGSDRFVAYVPISGDRRRSPASFPLPAEEDTLMVPAGRPFLIFRIRDGKPISAGPLVTVAPGQTIDGSSITPSARQRDLIAWIEIAPTSMPALEEIHAPVTRLIDSTGKSLRPLFDIEGAGVNESFVVFTDVAPGEWVLSLEGPQWKTVDRGVVLPAGEAKGVFVEPPLVGRLRHRVQIDWSLPAGVEDLPNYEASCASDPATQSVRDWHLRLLECPERRSDVPSHLQSTNRCRTVREEVVEEAPAGAVIFDLVSPGRYVAVMEAGGSRVGVERFDVLEDHDSVIRMEVPLTTLVGRVSAGGEPVKAVLRFATGTAATDDSGEYRAVLERAPEAFPIEVVPCDGSDPFEHIPAEPISWSGRYDIQVPGNSIEVDVIDAKTGEAIAHARVGRGLFETEEEAGEAVLDSDPALGEEGRAVLRRLQPGYFLRICATASGYAPVVCAKPIELREDTRERVTLSLRPANLIRGRVEAPGRIMGGDLWRTRASGEIVERIVLDPEGTFEFSPEPRAEFLIFTAVNFPLFVVHHPDIPNGEEEMKLSVPSTPSRSFTVEVSDAIANRSGWFTIAVGDALIHLTIISAHLTRRGLTGELVENTPGRVIDVIETAPLSVVAAVGVFPLPERLADLFLLPHYRSALIVRAVPPDGRVILER